MQNTSYNIFIHQLNTWYDPENAFVHFYGNSPYAFWLDSSKIDPETSRFSYMGDTNGPYAKRIRYSVTDGLLHITENRKTRRIKKSIFEYLEEELKKKSLERWEVRGGKLESFPGGFAGYRIVPGFVGYFGYEVQGTTMQTGLYQGNTPYKSTLPDAYFFFADRVIVFDHSEKKVYLVCVSDSKREAKRWFKRIKNEVRSWKFDVPRSHPPAMPAWRAGLQHPASMLKFKLARNHRQYIQDIKTCQEYLKKGESYQICLTNSFSANIQVDWLHVYLILRKMNPAPYSAYMRFGDFAVLSSSPEKFLSITPGGFAETKPIKGTMPRGKTDAEDQQFIQELKTSKKDWSENAMIVDLLKNDLGKVCALGSVQVKKFLAVETYQTVHQLVSTIQGRLRDDITAIDCVKACFPGGSMTGAPKMKTMEILSSLEKQARGIYSGALGFFSLTGETELSIIIRTIVATKNQLTIGSGGAILIDSDPEKEYDEMLLKTKVLLEAITKAFGANKYVIVGDRG